MECCVRVATETVLQIDKSYTIVKRILKLTFRTEVLRRSEKAPTKDYSPKRQF